MFVANSVYKVKPSLPTMSTPAGAGATLRRAESRMRCLRAIVRDTQRALSDVADVLTAGTAQFDASISDVVQEVGSRAARPPALLLLGCSCSCKARLANCLLGEQVLPTDETCSRWRWIRIQYGGSRQVQLNLSNSEFELVDELECQRVPWNIMPEKDLQRTDQSDLTTIMDIELPNPLLKDGLKIIIPPDLDSEARSQSLEELMQNHEDFYNRRQQIFRQFTPVTIYGLNCTGKHIFREHSCEISKRISKDSSRSEDDMWNTYNLYYTKKNKTDDENNLMSTSCDSDFMFRVKSDSDATREAYVFSPENCLDLQQIKELYPNLQMYFVLFADSRPIVSRHRRTDQSAVSKERENGTSVEKEVTESTEDDMPESDQELKERANGNTALRSHEYEQRSETDAVQTLIQQNAFMQELVDQWRLACCTISKGDPKNYWMILDDSEISKSSSPKLVMKLLKQSPSKVKNRIKWEDDDSMERRLVRTKLIFMAHVTKFVTEMVNSYLLDLCVKLSEVHIRLLQQFILTSFDMAREMQVVPKKIDYVAVHEQQLYETIHEKFTEGEKKEELLQIMQQVLQEIKTEINTMDWSVDDLPCHQEGKLGSNPALCSSTEHSNTEAETPEPDPPSQAPNDVEQAVSYDTYDFEDFDIVSAEETASLASVSNRRFDSSEISDGSEISSIRVENESINSSVLARMMDFGCSRKCDSNIQISIKQASLDVQKTVLTRLSRRISMRLVKFVDCLRDSYFGTLQRCLESLEAVCREELGGRTATEAMRRVLSVANQVDLQTCASFSVLRTLVEHMRRLFQRMRLGSGGPGGGACCVLSPVWRRDVARHTLQALSAQRLARLISAQILEKLAAAHEGYQAALAALSTALECRLHHTEDVKLAIRKRYAPGFARLCLESTSMCDVLQHGTPELGREIGRGQYGVVYACKSGWAGHDPCAVKSVLPSDERHFNELAMEFFYTRSIPPHPRIVRLWGSVVERHASGSPTVLLITERKRRDLHCAVRAADLPFSKRMRIAVDIVQGIRYLHSLGLVHRDIKMKNVLLDQEDRASLTDLGFCMPEALMSGSIVGTPVHMAPELLSGEYDSSVDVYAFGILFWYLCAGNIKLPSAFELVQNKEQLWSKVRKGLRPERLSFFSDECWRLMESCWASEPSKRALLGDVQPVLEQVFERSLQREETPMPIGSLESFDLRINWNRGDTLNFSRSDAP